jgi:hypothetical protein
LLRWGEVTPRRFFLRLDAGDPGEETALEAHRLIETTPLREGRALQLSQAFLMGLPCIRGTHEAEGTALIEHEEVLARGACLLAAVVCLLVLAIGGAVERSLRALMPTRGDGGTPSGRLAASITERSSACRAGRSA